MRQGGVPIGETVTPSLKPIADVRDGSHNVSGDALVGSRCASCGVMAFPARDVCMACGGRILFETPLPQVGTLYSLTTVHTSSSRPTPYTIGYVDLDGGVRLLAAIEGAHDQLLPDARVRLEVRGDNWLFVPGDER